MIAGLATNASSQDEFAVSKTTIGGYGELHYNRAQQEEAQASKMLDFHRFVIFLSHNWNEKWSFKSETELEHNFVKSGQGELELEQAYINYQKNQGFGFQAGVILASTGLLNEYHEPTTFLSVERPDYAKYIIPTTWFGNGISAYGLKNGFDYKLTVMEGLDGARFSASSGIRNGRQKGYKANADKLLYNARLAYAGAPGLRIGASFSTNSATVNDTTENRMTLLELHAKLERRNLFAQFEIGSISFGLGEVERAFGYYLDLGYNVGALFDTSTKIIPWARLGNYNTASRTKSGGDSEEAYQFSKMMCGIAVKPLPEIVFKVDYGIKKNKLSNVKTKLFNIGAGYMF